jgi:hypothetical protein
VGLGVSLLLASCGGRSTLGSDLSDIGEGKGGASAGARPFLSGGSASGGAPISSGSGGLSFSSGGVSGASVGGRAAFSRGGASSGGGVAQGGSGTGGSGTGGRAGGPPVSTPCPALPVANEHLVDDMEDGDRFILRDGGRAGAWFDGNDGTGAMMYPSPDAPFFMTKSTSVCFGNAVAVMGGPFTDWGANFGFGLGSPYDASRYAALSFWARVDPGTSATIRVGFPDRNSHPDGGLCVANASDANGCWDSHKARRQLTSNWAKYVISFSELRQDAWGYQGPFDPSTLFGVTFEIPANGVFSIWVDYVTLVR